MSPRRRRRLPQDVNVLAVLVVLCAFVLTLLDDLEPEAFLLLVTGLAIPAKGGGYQSTQTAPVIATPIEPAPADPEAGT